MEQLQARAVRRHEEILEAALAVFARKGYAAAAVDDIAEESRTSKGGVYFHFPGKKAIFLALMDRAARRLLDKVEAAVAAETEPLDKAETALRVVLATFAAHRPLARVFLVEAPGAGREFQEKLTEMRDGFIAVIEAHLNDAVTQGAIPPLNTALASRVWFGGISEVITHWLVTRNSGRLEETYEALRPLILGSLGASPRMNPRAVPAGRA